MANCPGKPGPTGLAPPGDDGVPSPQLMATSSCPGPSEVFASVRNAKVDEKGTPCPTEMGTSVAENCGVTVTGSVKVRVAPLRMLVTVTVTTKLPVTS